MAHALTAMDGFLSDAVRHRVKQLLYPLRLAGRAHELAAVDALAWKVLWIARPTALCPQAVGDPDRERTLDLGLSLLLTDLLAAPSRTEPDSPETVER
ncbi:hypothetical protein AB0436_21980 [Streptomyces sp. NPDC051322]|uniref:hypothetical protein n=1 Tax=Streptomyces sp. NPDC051322 TaxID=3154645 RepID=UPI00344C829B